MDTSPDAPGPGVEPIVHRDYDGGVIELPRGGTRLDPAAMPELTAKRRPRPRHQQRRHAARRRRQGRRGRDHGRGRVPGRAPRAAAADAAGRASRPTRRSARARRCSTSSASARCCAYTLDGSEIGELQDETFSAVEVIVTVTGVDVHPGQATGKLVNALRLAAADRRRAARRHADARDDLGPRGLHPPLRADRHRRAGASSARSCATSTTTSSSDHVALLERTAEEVVAAEPRARLEVDVRRAVPQHASLPRARCRTSSTAAEEAIRAEGIEPIRSPIRGGTDGSRLSEMGLPTPEHLHRRPRVPLGPRVGLGAGHGGGRGDGRAPGRGVDAAGVRARPAQVRLLPAVSAQFSASLASLDGDDHARLRGDDPGHRRGAAPRRRRVRGDPRLRRAAVRVRGAPARGWSARPRNLRLPLDLEAVRADAHRLLAHAGAGPDHELLRIVLTRGGRRLLLTEPLPPTPDRVRLASITYSPTRDPRRRQVAVVRGEHARRPARPRARASTRRCSSRRTAACSRRRPARSSGSRTATILTPPLDEHILASITRRDRDRGDRRARARVHAGGPARRRRGVPGLDRARGPAGGGDRRARFDGAGPVTRDARRSRRVGRAAQLGVGARAR